MDLWKIGERYYNLDAIQFVTPVKGGYELTLEEGLSFKVLGEAAAAFEQEVLSRSKELGSSLKEEREIARRAKPQA
jgi:hypothetical protein